MLLMKVASFFNEPSPIERLPPGVNEKIWVSSSKRELTLTLVLPALASFSGLNEAIIGFSELTSTALLIAWSSSDLMVRTSARRRRLPFIAFSQYTIDSLISSPPYSDAPGVLVTYLVTASMRRPRRLSGISKYQSLSCWLTAKRPRLNSKTGAVFVVSVSAFFWFFWAPASGA